MTDADLLINDDFVWSDATPPISGIADIQSVVAHEWGHAIGLDHVTTARATMFYSFPLGAIYFRTLHPDDEAAVASIYPAGSFDSSRATIRGTVDVLGRSNDRGVAVFAVDARTGEIAVSALSEKDGTYAVRGLLPGTYRIVAGPFIPLSPLNAYWKSSATDFLAAPLTDTGVSPGPTTLITVTGGDDESGHDLSVAARSSPFEPDGSAATATPISTGDSVAARLESSGDRDYYRLAGTQGQRVTIYVHSSQIGGDLDPRVELLDPDGATVLDQSRDISTAGASLQGPDSDCRLEHVFASSGDHFVRVRPQNWTLDLENPVYVLNVSAGPDAPDPDRSEYTADPTSVDADGVSTSLISVVPRNRFGEAISGASVQMQNQGVGTLGPVQEIGGAFVATLTASASPGAAPIDVTIASSDGMVSVPAALTVYCVGPTSATQSEIRAEPGRIPFDGTATSTIMVVPRDDLAQPMGSGRTVLLSLDGPGSLSGVQDLGNGSYQAVLTAPTEEAKADVTLAEVDGVAVGITVTVSFGFDLEEVVREVRDAVTALLDEPGTPAKSRKKLAKAADQLDEALEKLLTSDVSRALKQVGKAARFMEKAQRKAGGAIDVSPEMTNLVLACRQTAKEEVESVQATDPRTEKKLGNANARLDKGDAALAAGKFAKAAKKFRQAYVKAAKL
jgi:hypothetical protein